MNKQDLDEFIEHAELNFLPNSLLWGDGWAKRAIEIAKEFRKTLEQEPIGYADQHDLDRDGHDFWVSRQKGKNTVPLYANPININPLTAEAWCNGYEAATKQFKRNWVGLTDDETDILITLHAPPIHPDFNDDDDFIELVSAIEAKLKEKNQ